MSIAELVVTEMSYSHFSHPDHPLVLKEDLTVEEDVACYGCNKSVIGFPTFTCTNPGDNIDCQSFYLHESCAELPTQITPILMHRQHPLLLVFRSLDTYICDCCDNKCSRLHYRCDHCDFDICLNCAPQGEEHTIQHRGHSNDHCLIFIQREALFRCDACGVKAEEASYKCTSCQFWIHKSCASLPDIISTPTYHHHPLHLIFSVPDMHQSFLRYCNLCKKLIQKFGWAYYCHKCTYFVHLKCAKSADTERMISEIEGDCLDTESDLLQIPLATEDSLLDFIIQQVGKFKVKFEGEDSASTTSISKPIPDGPLLHRSHREHQLKLLEYSTSSHQILDGDDDKEGDEKVLVCDGCIQPVTASRPSYYACLQCDFFLHSCATKLPWKLPAGASQSHLQHTLSLRMTREFYVFRRCSICDSVTNGFYYKCEEETCDFIVDIICAFLPSRIRHESHKHHPLVQRASSGKERCSVTKVQLNRGMEYGCETCNDFQINMVCLRCPSRMKHKYDDHPIELKNPPFFYEGVIYCEICEEEANNQWWLYHCGGECDHSFHPYCLGEYGNVKRGGRIEYTNDNQPHALTLVIKRRMKKTPLYYCSKCGDGYRIQFFLECVGCGFLMCSVCAHKIFD